MLSQLLRDSLPLSMKSKNLHELSSFSNPVIAVPKWSYVAGQFVRLLLLALAVCALWLTLENRWGSKFCYPTRYTGDSHYILGMMKLAKDGDLGLFTHITTKSLGAPFIGQLNDFPQTERMIVWLGGQVARAIGLMPAANTMLILSALVAAFSFYFSARLWRVSPLVSWLLAIVYAFLPQSQRSLDHMGIGFTGLLPLQFYCLWYITVIQDFSWRSSRFKLTFAISILSGFLNIYWVFLFLNLYVISLICRLVKGRKLTVMALIPLGMTCLMAALMLGSFVIYRMSYGGNAAALVRSYHDVEQYALKPIDMLIPNWGAFLSISSDFFSRYYDGGRFEIGESWWGAYIGIFAVVGLLLLLLNGIKRQLNKRSPSLPFLAACWIIAYVSFGGVHSGISLVLDFYDIRSTTRYSAALASIGLLYLTFVISRCMKKWSFSTRFVVLFLLSLLAISDQYFKIYTFPFDDNRSIEERVIADRALALKLESCLDAGAMLYAMPVLDFPEPFSGRGAYRSGLSFYNSMRPFLYSTKLRYSYGSNKGRQGADWQLDLQELPAMEIAPRLESYGFSGILLNRKGYRDRGAQLLAEFTAAGWSIEFEQGIGNEWVFIRLNPSENPILPTLTPYAISAKN